MSSGCSESYIHPITILSTLPSASVEEVLALLATRTELTIIAVIGTILLIGIVKKNGVMMVDFALEAERTKDKRNYKIPSPLLSTVWSPGKHAGIDNND